MRVFITGGSGVLGRRLVRLLVASGYEVKALTRSEKADQTIRDCGGIPCRGDHFNTDSLVASAEGSEIVIHAATAIPSTLRFSRKDWETNDRLRREGTQALAESAGRIGAKMYLQQSIVWVARPSDDAFFDEDTVPRPDPVFASSLDAEKIANEAGKKFGFHVILLRCGMFYSADAIHTKMIADGLRKKKSPIVGSGNAIWAMIHADDAAFAFAIAAQSQRSGLWHIVDQQPVRVAKFFQEFARDLEAPRPKHVPVWIARLLIGKETTAHFLRSTRTSSARFQKDFAWTPRYPGYQEGLWQVAEILTKEKPGIS
jgi:2-alkyl-3-oxoalkanoate reductase